MCNIKILQKLIALLIISSFCFSNLFAQSPTVDISIEDVIPMYNDAGDSIYHNITIGFDIDYGDLPLSQIRLLNFDLQILDQDEINWFLNNDDFDFCNGQTGYDVDTTGFAVDSIASIQFEFDNGINARKMYCQKRGIATVGILIEPRNNTNQRLASDIELNNECSFRQKADLFIAALNPTVTLADQSISTMANDTLIQRKWLKTCGLPDLQPLEYDTHFKLASYNNDTVVIELMLRYNDDYSFINGEDTLYFSTGNIRFLFDSLGLVNPRFLPCDGCAEYTDTGSGGNLVSFNYNWLTDYKVATKQRIALIEFDIIQPTDTVCARLIYNEPPAFPYTRIFNTGNEELLPAGYDIYIFCPNQFEPDSPF